MYINARHYRYSVKNIYYYTKTIRGKMTPSFIKKRRSSFELKTEMSRLQEKDGVSCPQKHLVMLYSHDTTQVCNVY